MKTNYPLRSKPKNNDRKRLLIIIASFVVVAGFGFAFPNFSRNTAYTISKPIWSFRSVAGNGFSSVVSFFKFKNSLIAKNEELVQEIEALKLKEIDYDILQKENQDLKAELGRRSDSKRIIVKALSKPPVSPYDTIVIDAGSSDGILLGDRVYMGDNIIIGIVTNVTAHTSLVELFSNGNNKQEAILSRTGTTFTLVGQGGANMKLEVPKDADIIWGDTFTYPSLSGAIVGSVYYIDTNSQSSFETIYIKAPFNVFSSKYLYVGR